MHTHAAALVGRKKGREEKEAFSHLHLESASAAPVRFSLVPTRNTYSVVVVLSDREIRFDYNLTFLFLLDLNTGKIAPPPFIE